jgi:hypothetical protein
MPKYLDFDQQQKIPEEINPVEETQAEVEVPIVDAVADNISNFGE